MAVILSRKRRLHDFEDPLIPFIEDRKALIECQPIQKRKVVRNVSFNLTALPDAILLYIASFGDDASNLQRRLCRKWNAVHIRNALICRMAQDRITLPIEWYTTFSFILKAVKYSPLVTALGASSGSSKICQEIAVGSFCYIKLKCVSLPKCPFTKHFADNIMHRLIRLVILRNAPTTVVIERFVS